METKNKVHYLLALMVGFVLILYSVFYKYNISVIMGTVFLSLILGVLIFRYHGDIKLVYGVAGMALIAGYFIGGIVPILFALPPFFISVMIRGRQRLSTIIGYTGLLTFLLVILLIHWQKQIYQIDLIEETIQWSMEIVEEYERIGMEYLGEEGQAQLLEAIPFYKNQIETFRLNNISIIFQFVLIMITVLTLLMRGILKLFNLYDFNLTSIYHYSLPRGSVGFLSVLAIGFFFGIGEGTPLLSVWFNGINLMMFIFSLAGLTFEYNYVKKIKNKLLQGVAAIILVLCFFLFPLLFMFLGVIDTLLGLRKRILIAN